MDGKRDRERERERERKRERETSVPHTEGVRIGKGNI